MLLGGPGGRNKAKFKKEEITNLPLSFWFSQSVLVSVFIDIFKDNYIVEIWVFAWTGKIQLKMNCEEFESIIACRYRSALSGV